MKKNSMLFLSALFIFTPACASASEVSTISSDYSTENSAEEFKSPTQSFLYKRKIYSNEFEGEQEKPFCKIIKEACKRYLSSCSSCKPCERIAGAKSGDSEEITRAKRNGFIRGSFLATGLFGSLGLTSIIVIGGTALFN